MLAPAYPGIPVRTTGLLLDGLKSARRGRPQCLSVKQPLGAGACFCRFLYTDLWGSLSTAICAARTYLRIRFRRNKLIRRRKRIRVQYSEIALCFQSCFQWCHWPGFGFAVQIQGVYFVVSFFLSQQSALSLSPPFSSSEPAASLNNTLSTRIPASLLLETTALQKNTLPFGDGLTVKR
jgi:hypothetical protein